MGIGRSDTQAQERFPRLVEDAVAPLRVFLAGDQSFNFPSGLLFCVTRGSLLWVALSHTPRLHPSRESGAAVKPSRTAEAFIPPSDSRLLFLTNLISTALDQKD